MTRPDADSGAEVARDIFFLKAYTVFNVEQAVPDVSQRLAEYLEDPIVQADGALWLRCFVIKSETDEDAAATCRLHSARS